MLNFYLAFLIFHCVSSVDEWAVKNPLLQYDPYCQVQLPHHIAPSGLCVAMPTSSSSFALNFCGQPNWQFIVKTNISLSAIVQIPWGEIERDYPNCKLRQLICAELSRPCLSGKCHHNLKLNCEFWALIPREFCLKIRQYCPFGILPADLKQCEQRSAQHFIGLKKELKKSNLTPYKKLLFHAKCKMGKNATKWMKRFGQFKFDHHLTTTSLDLVVIIIFCAIIFLLSILTISANFFRKFKKSQSNFSSSPLIYGSSPSPPNFPPPSPPLFH